MVKVQNLDLSTITQGWGSPSKNRSVDGAQLKINGLTFDHGIGTHAISRFLITLNGQADRFISSAGLDDEVGPGKGSVQFIVKVDGVTKYKSPVMTYGMPAVQIIVPLKGAKKLELDVSDAGDGIDYDHADWIDPLIYALPGKGSSIHAYRPPAEPMPQIHHGFDRRPLINGAQALGCSAGKPFVWLVPVTGAGQVHVTVHGLPAGLHYNSATRVVSGEVKAKGVFQVHVTAKSKYGTDHRTVKIDSSGVLALTPPMGWNSWNVWAGSVSQAKVVAAGKAFLRDGLAQAGYQYINVDDTWEAKRSADGKITGNDRFPSMAGMASAIHKMGLRAGLYSSPGPYTCAGFDACYQHEQQDANTYADWGFDYLKYDWCSYGSIAPKPDLAALEKPYTLMSGFLKQSSRDIVFSLCQYGMGDVWNWGASVGGNLWRCTGDINDSWSSMSGIAFQGSKWVNGAGPGHWNDPDMLVVGRLGWSSQTHPTKLTPNEQMTHITMWSLLAAPLIIGCDLDHIDAWTLDLLTNHDVVDVDQDVAGHAATQVKKMGDIQIWSRSLADKGRAVGLFNLGDDPKSVTFSLSEIGWSSAHKLRNLWTQKDLGSHKTVTFTIPRHGCVLLKAMR